MLPLSAIESCANRSSSAGVAFTDGAKALEALVMAAQKVENYEIASYGSLKTIAQDCGESEVAALLGKTLEEEKATDEKLTRLAETEINKTAIAASPSA